ncbi:MAG: hypothetical protein GY820_25285 [Gammaproteobacteria bacterium]|nr:hypothetical protein [Gammaproteobacteria bacterium]
MQLSHLNTIHRYDESRKQARELAWKGLPPRLKRLKLAPVNNIALIAFSLITNEIERSVDWDWNFASQYCRRYPKAFDLAVWNGNSLCSLSLGRPTYKGTEMRLDFIEKFTNNPVFSGGMFGVSLIAYEAYGKVIGASKLRIMNPENEKLIKYYSSFGGFSYKKSLKGNPHYLVKSI